MSLIHAFIDHTHHTNVQLISMIPAYVASLVSVCCHCFSEVPFFPCPKAWQPRSKEPSASRQIHTLRNMQLYHVILCATRSHHDALILKHLQLGKSNDRDLLGKGSRVPKCRIAFSGSDSVQKKQREPAEEGRQSNSPQKHISTSHVYLFPARQNKGCKMMQTSFVGVAAQNLGLTKQCSVKTAPQMHSTAPLLGNEGLLAAPGSHWR